MSRKLRIFLSSTMRDLANERDAICTRLRSFNFEPVNAEGWVPTGAGSWTRISQEIESSDVFLLIGGERYGWIPTDGPKGELGLSVTHLEYQDARTRELPILAFFKNLTYDTDRTSDDAQKRDAFRIEVSDWAKGQFVGSFDLASDLADSAGRALIELLTNEFVSRKIREREHIVETTTRLLSEGPTPRVTTPPIAIPPRLVDVMRNRTALLFAGAGFSQSAGLPSAVALGQHLAGIVRAEPEYARGPGAAAFATIASDVAVYAGRYYLEHEVVRVLDPPLGLQPTTAHKKAVTLFDLILTTNWDALFEIAATIEGQEFSVVIDEFRQEPAGRAIVKLHGSIRDPSTLLLTEYDILRMDSQRPRLWRWVRYLLSTHTLVVVGSSLRDPSVFRLLSEATPRTAGYFIAPTISAMTTARLNGLKLEGIAADSDEFFVKLADEVAQGVG